MITFAQLNINDYFEFLEKTNVGHGLFNGIGRKVSKTDYRMVCLHTIGNQDIKVIKKELTSKDKSFRI